MLRRASRKAIERAEVLGAVALVLRDSGLSPAEAEVRAEAVA